MTLHLEKFVPEEPRYRVYQREVYAFLRRSTGPQCTSAVVEAMAETLGERDYDTVAQALAFMARPWHKRNGWPYNARDYAVPCVERVSYGLYRALPVEYAPGDRVLFNGEVLVAQ